MAVLPKVWAPNREGQQVTKQETVHYCEAFARKGTGFGSCDRPLDKDGYCDRAGDHMTDEFERVNK